MEVFVVGFFFDWRVDIGYFYVCILLVNSNLFLYCNDFNVFINKYDYFFLKFMSNFVYNEKRKYLVIKFWVYIWINFKRKF